MLETIKRTEQMRLDELIKYCRDNDIKNKSFYTVSKGAVRFNDYGEPVSVPSEIKFDNKGCIVLWGYLDPEESFEVEIEEPITEDTFFEQCVIVFENDFENDFVFATSSVHTVRSINEAYDDVKYIHGIVNGKLELVWEKQN